MAEYPDAIATLPRPAGNQKMDGTGIRGSVMIDALADEIEATQTTLGPNPQGDADTVGERLDAGEDALAAVDGRLVAAENDVDELQDDVTTLTNRANDVDSALEGVDTSIAALESGKADDSGVVHLAGDESIDGTKTFLDAPVSITPAAGPNELITLSAAQTLISAAINAAIDGAPGALDTLNELAAALGDDPNYAATVNALLAAKTAKAANLSDLANIATARTNLGLGGAAVLNVGTTAGTVAAGDDGRLSDTRTPTDNTVSTAKVVARAVTFPKLPAIATSRLLGRVTAASGDIEELTSAQATAMLDAFTTSLKGLCPAASASPSASKFLTETGTWATVSAAKVLHASSNAPAGSDGVQGDWWLKEGFSGGSFYADPQTGLVYGPKGASSWPSVPNGVYGGRFFVVRSRSMNHGPAPSWNIPVSNAWIASPPADIDTSGLAIAATVGFTAASAGNLGGLSGPDLQGNAPLAPMAFQSHRCRIVTLPDSGRFVYLGAMWYDSGTLYGYCARVTSTGACELWKVDGVNGDAAITATGTLTLSAGDYLYFERFGLRIAAWKSSPASATVPALVSNKIEASLPRAQLYAATYGAGAFGFATNSATAVITEVTFSG